MFDEFVCRQVCQHLPFWWGGSAVFFKTAFLMSLQFPVRGEQSIRNKLSHTHIYTYIYIHISMCISEHLYIYIHVIFTYTYLQIFSYSINRGFKRQHGSTVSWNAPSGKASVHFPHLGVQLAMCCGDLVEWPGTWGRLKRLGNDLGKSNKTTGSGYSYWKAPFLGANC